MRVKSLRIKSNDELRSKERRMDRKSEVDGMKRCKIFTERIKSNENLLISRNWGINKTFFLESFFMLSPFELTQISFRLVFLHRNDPK